MSNTFLDKLSGSVFYPLISNCIASIHGSLDITSRGLINEIQVRNLNRNETEALLSSAKMNEKIKLEFLNNLVKTPLFGQISFTNSINEQKFEVDIEELSKQVFQKKFNPSHHIYQAIKILIITSYEVTKEINDKSPIWEFFRHIRNASAHGGRFNLLFNKYEKKQEPVREAKWRSKEINESLHGTKLLIESPDIGLLYTGDVILLLLDIEDQYPMIKSISFD